MIKFTVVTCTYQAEKELQRTLDSVQRQTYCSIEHKGYPASLLANEIQLKCGDKVLRADSVLYSRELQPRMIIEYKAPHIPITQKVFDQISVYNLLLHVDFLVVSNGLEHYICKMDYESKKYVFFETIPDYSDLLTL